MCLRCRTRIALNITGAIAPGIISAEIQEAQRKDMSQTRRVGPHHAGTLAYSIASRAKTWPKRAASGRRHCPGPGDEWPQRFGVCPALRGGVGWAMDRSIRTPSSGSHSVAPMVARARHRRIIFEDCVGSSEGAHDDPATPIAADLPTARLFAAIPRRSWLPRAGVRLDRSSPTRTPPRSAGKRQIAEWAIRSSVRAMASSR